MEQKVRELTVSLVTTPNNCYEGKRQNVPYLRLQGKWMEQLGFHIGDKVKVFAGQDNELRIQVKR